MILLSKVIKSSFAKTIDSEKKTIALKKVILENQFGEDVVQSNNDHFVESNIKLAEEKLQIAIEEAEKIKQEAQAEYEMAQQRINDEIIANQIKAEEMYKQAEENGYNEGFQQGLQEGQKQYETFIEEAREVVAASKRDYFQRLDESEPAIVQLAIKVAEKIISNTLDTNQDEWLSIVKDVINEVREQEQVKIYVHPNWYEFTLSHKEELRLQLPNCDHLYIYPDVHLEEHGCLIETPYGKIDASVDSQLTEMKDALLEKLKELGGYEGS